MHVVKLTRAAWAGALLALAACETEAAREQAKRTERAAIAASESTAVRVAAAPSTGLWSEDAVLERLVRAGVVPRKVDGAPAGPDWMKRRATVIAAGGGELYVWIYADSTARRAVTDSLDAATGAPAGRPQPFASPMVFLVQNNLAAILPGGRETNPERIALALQAGLPVRP